MTLTKDQKEALKSLKNHPGYAVLLLVEEDAKVKLGKQMFTFDMSNPTHIEAMKRNQTYQVARDDLLKNLDSHTREIYTPDATK